MKKRAKTGFSEIPKQNQYKSLLWKMLCKRFHGRHILFSLLFSFSVFSNQEKICELLEPWKISICSETNEKLSHVSNTLHTQLEASLIRKKVLPEETIEAGKAVFNIGIQYELHEWSWNFSGGSGFFMFDTQTFFSAYHVLGPLLDNISQLSEIVFKDQNGNSQEFEVKGIKFASKLRDIVIFEVEGYDGPVLELSLEPPQEQSYIMGYSEGFKIQSVRAFEATDIHYATFIELFDCYYGVNFGGASGGPLVNQKGKVEGVFTNMVDPPLRVCNHFLLARKLDFLAEKGETVRIYDSIEEIKELMDSEENNFVTLAEEGNMNAQYELLDEESFLNSAQEVKEAITSGNTLMLNALMSEATFRFLNAIDDNLLDKALNKIKTKVPFIGEEAEITEILVSFIEEGVAASELLPVTWYKMGAITYYISKNLEKACDFWNKARQTGHPFVFSDFVVVPPLDIIACEF